MITYDFSVKQINMPFYKKCTKRECVQKYGSEQGSQQGYFADESIKIGELVYECDPIQCDYLNDDGRKVIEKTKEETLQLCQEQPHLKDFIQKYAFMIEDDLFTWPRGYMEQKTVCQCLFLNHSCEPNLGHGNNDTNKKIAIRDIEPGEELTIHYTYFDTENSLDTGIFCKCGSKTCVGLLKYDEYRNIDWQQKFYSYTSIVVFGAFFIKYI